MYALASAAAALVGLVVPALSLQSAAPKSGPRTFDTPRQAADALVQAAKADDVAAIVAIFGADGKDIVPSGDPVQDKNDIARFAERAGESLEIAFTPGNPNRAVLVVGEDDWPMPVPVVKRGGKWQFDPKQGKKEILTRRIGNNELEAIALLRGYVEAQEDYASEKRDGSPMLQYARKWVSSPGKQDGLSWRNPDGTPGGPVGDEIAELLAKGYTDKGAPINGYYFRTLTAQGPAAPTGSRDYIVNGMMIGGFAAIAWPAQYGVTGVQTFQVSYDGVVFQKDLGPETGKIAPTIKRYDPDNTWLATEDEE
jgi:hypothetical protein